MVDSLLAPLALSLSPSERECVYVSVSTSLSSVSVSVVTGAGREGRGVFPGGSFHRVNYLAGTISYHTIHKVGNME